MLWRQANITPSHKSGCKLTLTNFRGISLKSVLCKTMERIISSHIRVHLSNFDIISKTKTTWVFTKPLNCDKFVGIYGYRY